MEPRTPEDRSVLAGEYVLGTLAADERREAEALRAGDESFRREVWWWERRFAALGLRLEPLAPRPIVWLRLSRRMQAGEPVVLRPARSGLVAAWAWLATAASVALAIALGMLLRQPPPAPQIVTQRVEVPVPATSYVALLQMPQSKLQWAVSVTPERAQLNVRAEGELPENLTGRDPELWLITDHGPVSLGVMPKRGEVQRALPAGLSFAPGKALAVSLEPPGGSPTGQPTGPVVTTAAVLKAG